VDKNVNPLPLHWLDFTCTAINNKAVSINWKTLNEENVSYFIIQRSRPGGAFENIAKKHAANRPYNEYLYFDELLDNAFGKWFYRLLSIDKDGRKTYSQIRSVTFGDAQPALVVYPNPVKNNVNINACKMKELTLADAMGRIMISKKLNSENHVEINVSSLPKGLYLLRIKNAEGNIETQKLILE